MSTLQDWSFKIEKAKKSDPIFLEKKWQELLRQSDNALCLLQSPEWVRSLKFQKDEVYFCLLFDSTNQLAGLVPLTIKHHKIKFDIKAKTYLSAPVLTINIVGSLPLIPEDNTTYDMFFAELLEYFPQIDGLYFDSVDLKSFMWSYLNESRAIKRRFFLHIPEGVRNHFSLIFSGSFEGFLHEQKKNRRRDFRKRLKRFDESSGHENNLIRICDENQVDFFLDTAHSISNNSWQMVKLGNRINTSKKNRLRLKELANSGVLRSYLLFCGNIPSAFRLGYQFGDNYFGFESGYDTNLKKLSPGKILTLKMLEDFSTERPPRMVDFGNGEAQWKHDFCNNQRKDASIFLLKKRFRNKLLVFAQTNFYALIKIIKNIRLNIVNQ